MIGIIGAMAKEVEELKALLEDIKVKESALVKYFEGKLCGADVVVAQSGIGKVNSALCAQNMINLFHPDVIINTGVGAGVGKDVHIGDIVMAKDVVQHDMDTSIFGEPKGFISGIDIVNIPTDKKYTDEFIEIAKKNGMTVHCGTIASGDQFLSDNELKVAIRDTFNALAVEMEGASIGQACHMNNTPFVILRSVSDSGNETAQETFEEFVEKVNKKNVEMLKIFAEGKND